MTFKVKNKISLKEIFFLSIENLFSISIISIITSLIIGINPSTIFLLNSVNNIIYLILNNFRFPSYLIPNLMLISPIIRLSSKYEYKYILNGFIFYGIIFLLSGLIIKKYGFYWLNFIFPPKILGLIITIIGLDLSNISIQKLDVSNWKLMSVFLFTFFVIFISSIFWNRILFVPIFIGLISGYTLALYFKIISFKELYKTPWFVFPEIYFPKWNFNLDIFCIIFPVILFSIVEYVSFIIITKRIYNNNYLNEKNLLFKSIFINSILNIILSFLGSIPSNFYNNSMKFMSISLNKFNLIIFLTSILFIFISFLGKIFVFIKLIPMQIILSISLFMYGIIISSGIKIMIDSNINFNNFKNVILIFIAFISGISDFKLVYKNIEIKGLVLTIFVVIVLNLLFKFINFLKIKFKNIFFF